MGAHESTKADNLHPKPSGVRLFRVTGCRLFIGGRGETKRAESKDGGIHKRTDLDKGKMAAPLFFSSVDPDP